MYGGTEETRDTRYLAQLAEVSRLRGEEATAAARLDSAYAAIAAARAHRDDLLSLSRARRPRWWPLCGRRAHAARLAGEVQNAIEEKVKALARFERTAERVAAQVAHAEQELDEMLAEATAEKIARERYEAGEEPRDSEKRLFAEFAEQDRRAARGPEGRRMEDAINRYIQNEPPRTDEERGWYEEFREAEAEEAEDIWEGVKTRREAERHREFLAEWGEAPV